MEILKDPALRPLVLQYFGIALVAFAVFGYVTIKAWPANRMIFRSLGDWFERRYTAFLCRVSPEFRRRQEMLERYMIHVSNLQVYQAIIRRLMDETAQADKLALVADPTFSSLVERRDLARIKAAEYFAALPDEDLAVIVENIFTSFRGRVPIEELTKFMKSERERARTSPGEIESHPYRLVATIATFVPEMTLEPRE